MKKLFFLISIIIFGNHVYCQLQDRIWIFGQPMTGSSNATLYFGDQANPVVDLPSGMPNNISSSNGSEQWAIVTDPVNGNLVFYTDGKDVFNSQNQLVSSLEMGGNPSSSQPVAIAPVPNAVMPKTPDSLPFSQYYIFSNPTGADPSAHIGPVTYRIYDAVAQTYGQSMSLPGIYGSSPVTEGMKLIPCDENRDILWLIVSLYPNPGYERKYVVYKIFKSEISFQSECDMGPVKQPSTGIASPILDITYTKAGTTMGYTNVGFALQYSSAVYTCQFDNINGQFLTNTVKTCNTGYPGSMPSVYNLEFSPNGKYMYYSVYATDGGTNSLFQVDLQESTLSPTLVNSFQYKYGGGLKLGPDGRIYHIYDCGYYSNLLKLGRILQPDVKFISGVTNYIDFYQENFMTYPNVFGFGLCEFLVLPTHLYGITTEKAPMKHVALYPNPATDQISVKINDSNSANLTLNLYSVLGNLIQTQTVSQNDQSINTSGLSEGVYFVEIKSKSWSEKQKVIIQK